MTNNQPSSTTASTREELMPAAGTVVHHVQAAAVAPVVATSSAFIMPMRPSHGVVSAPHSERIRYVINVRSQDPKDAIRKANEILEREDAVTPTTAPEEEAR